MLHPSRLRAAHAERREGSTLLRDNPQKIFYFEKTLSPFVVEHDAMSYNMYVRSTDERVFSRVSRESAPSACLEETETLVGSTSV